MEICRLLIRRVAEWARDGGYETLLLSTFSDVPWNAPYYARVGFVAVSLEAYTPDMHAQRERDGNGGLQRLLTSA